MTQHQVCDSRSQERFFSRIGSGIAWERKRVSQSMRSILIDWLIEVAEEYNLKLRTLELARSYVDRFLKAEGESHRTVLQLIGVTCVLVAACVLLRLICTDRG